MSLLRSGSFDDAASARSFVQRTVDRQRDRIAHWLAGQGTARLVIGAWFDGEVTGRVVRWGMALYGDGSPLEVSGVRVVLRRDERTGNGFVVLTAYPVED